MNGFYELEVYQRASTMFPKVYRMVRTWNQVDQRELGSQMIRAANSIHANVAEGYAKTPIDFKRYVGNGIGSCNELISHIHDACNVGLIDEKTRDDLVAEYQIIVKQLARLRQKWQ